MDLRCVGSVKDGKGIPKGVAGECVQLNKRNLSATTPLPGIRVFYPQPNDTHPHLHELGMLRGGCLATHLLTRGASAAGTQPICCFDWHPDKIGALREAIRHTKSSIPLYRVYDMSSAICNLNPLEPSAHVPSHRDGRRSCVTQDYVCLVLSTRVYAWQSLRISTNISFVSTLRVRITNICLVNFSLVTT